MGSVQITARDAKMETIRILNYAHVRYTALACTMERAQLLKFLLRPWDGAPREGRGRGQLAFERRLLHLLTSVKMCLEETRRALTLSLLCGAD